MTLRPRSKSQHGFTLIELLVVLSIIAMVIAVSTPLLRGTPRHVELRKTAMEIASMLRTARSEAVARNSETVFSMEITTGRYWIRKNRYREIPQHLSKTLRSAAEEQISSDIGRIRFFPDGASTGGSITLSDGENTQTLTVNWLTGTVTLK